MMTPKIKKLLKKTSALVTAAALVFGTVSPAQAGLDSLMQGMYTAAASPSYMASANMRVFSGGYVAVRFPTENFNIISFTPPNFSVGCGGIDAYFGAFSFINSTQLEALIKAIGQDAVPYLFKMALGSMCQQCLAALDDLAASLQKMSSMINNACTLDAGIFAGNSPSLLAKNVEGTFKGLNIAAGQTVDAFTGFFKDIAGNTPNANKQLDSNAAGVPSSQTGAPSSNATGASTTLVGNMSWKGLAKNNVVSAFTGETNDAQTAEILMSLMGTVIVNLPEGTGAASGTGNAGGNAPAEDGVAASTNDQPVEHSLTLDDLVTGKPDAQVLQCEPYPIGSSVPEYPAVVDGGGQLDLDACRAIAPPSSTYTLKSLGYMGIDNYVDCAMVGTTPDAAVNCASVDSGPGIVAEIQAGVPYSAWPKVEQEVAADVPVRFVQYLSAVNGNPAMQQTIASSVLPYARAFAAVNLGVAVRKAIVNTYSGSLPEQVPDDLNQVLQTLNAQMLKYSDVLAKSMAEDRYLHDYVSTYLKSLNVKIPGQ
jgi:conjugative transfer pilus assembly protein TraH